MSPAAFRALLLFRDSEGPSEILEKRAFDYARAAGWGPGYTSFDSAGRGGGGDGGDGGDSRYQGPQDDQGDHTPSGQPGGDAGEGGSWWSGMVPDSLQGAADAARFVTPGGIAAGAVTSPMGAGFAAGAGLVGGTVSAMRGKGFAEGAKSWSGANAVKDVWNTVKAPVQTAKAMVSGASPLVAATGAGRILPGIGAGIGIAQSGYGAVTGDQNYMSDGFLGQMGEQGARTIGNLMSGAKLGPKGLMAVGGAELANVGMNAGRAVGSSWDAASSARDAEQAGQQTLGKVQGGMQQGTKDWLDKQDVSGKSDSSWYNPFSWGSGSSESTARKAWGATKMKGLDEGLSSGRISQQDYDLGRKHMGTLLSKYDPNAEAQSGDYQAADNAFSAIQEGMRATPKSPPAPAADSSGSTTPSPVNKK